MGEDKSTGTIVGVGGTFVDVGTTDIVGGVQELSKSTTARRVKNSDFIGYTSKKNYIIEKKPLQGRGSKKLLLSTSIAITGTFIRIKCSAVFTSGRST